MNVPRWRTQQEWEAWWAEFKKRNGLDKLVAPLPAPPVDAPEPTPSHHDTEREPGSDDDDQP